MKKLQFSLLLVVCFICSIRASAQKILVKTEMGNIVLQLDPKKAPVSSENFLKYLNAHLYDGAKFYRVVRMDNQADKKVKIEVIQGGVGSDTTRNFPAITHESTNITGLKHLKGTLSMARVGPGTADSEFFICVTDQPELDFGGKRNPDGQGFAAFGTVTSGMDIVEKIQKGKTGQGDKNQTLVQPVKILSMRILP